MTDNVTHLKIVEDDLDPINLIDQVTTMAEQIKNHEFGPLRSMTIVLERMDGTIEVFGPGDNGLLRSIGALHLGIQRLSEMRTVNKDNR